MSHAPMPGADGLAEPMRSRWSPSIFDPEHRLRTDEVATLLHAAQWAPSHGNLQPWRFFVAERGSAVHQVLLPHLTRGNAGWVPRASVVFLVAVKIAAEPGEEKPTDAAVNLYSAGQATAHLTLQAHATGLWARQFQGFDKEAVARELGVPPQWRLVAAVAVGVRGDPADAPERERERERRVRWREDLTEIAYGSTWGAPWQGVDARGDAVTHLPHSEP